MKVCLATLSLFLCVFLNLTGCSASTKGARIRNASLARLAANLSAEEEDTPIIPKLSINYSGSVRCANFNGRVKCWGNGPAILGVLYTAGLNARGDAPGEMGDALPFVDLGANQYAQQVVVNDYGACALLQRGKVRCWGSFGFPNSHAHAVGGTAIGDDIGELGDNNPFGNFGTGVSVAKLAAGTEYMCALMTNGKVKCWGYAGSLLGYGDSVGRGDDDASMGDNLPYVDLGTDFHGVDIVAGHAHTCVTARDGRIKCFGGASAGQIGTGDKNTRGDGPGEMGDALPYLDLGTNLRVRKLALGSVHSCALFTNNKVKCWGYQYYNRLGLVGDIGDQPGEMGDNLPFLDLGAGRTAKDLFVGPKSVCIVSDDNSVRCGGDLFMRRQEGVLTSWNTPFKDLPAIDFGRGRRVVQMALGNEVSCFSLDNGAVKCWGRGDLWGLGYGSTSSVVADAPGKLGSVLPPIKFFGAESYYDVAVKNLNYVKHIQQRRTSRSEEVFELMSPVGNGVACAPRLDIFGQRPTSQPLLFDDCMTKSTTYWVEKLSPTSYKAYARYGRVTLVLDSATGLIASAP